MTILIVDDSFVMRALIKRAIAVAGGAMEDVTVLEAADGREALTLLDANAVDVLVTDLNMPVMSGMELLQDIRLRGRWPDLVCAVVSTDGSAARRAAVKALGVEWFLGKPFRPEVMRDVLSQVRSRAVAR